MNLKRLFFIIIILIIILPTFFNGVFADEKLSSYTVSSERYGKGYRYNTHGWIYVHIEGKPYERGFQHGYLLADEIIDIINRWDNIFPQKLSWKLQKIDAVRLFWNKYPNEYKAEIKGIADGIAKRRGNIDGMVIDYKDILTLNEMYELLSRYRTVSVYPNRLRDQWWALKIKSIYRYLKSTSEEVHSGKCSAFLATGDYTTNGDIVAAHSTWGSTVDDNHWWQNYIAGRWNVLLDIKPLKGNRILMSTSPGLIWSDEDFYQNDAGMILMETTFAPPGPWSRFGDPIVVRARKAIQYSNNINKIVNFFLKKNNGLMANDWLIGDTKTGEIASLELAFRHHSLTKTDNGVIWSCNNAKDNKVRWELNSFTRISLLGRIIGGPYKPNIRDKKFEKFFDEYKGKVDENIAKIIMSTDPICRYSTDCKITSSRLINNFGMWAYMGKPDGTNFIADENPYKEPKQSYTDMPACGWIQIFPISKTNIFKHNPQKNNGGKSGNLLWEYEIKKDEFGNEIYNSPIVENEMIYLITWGGKLSAIDINNYKLLWEQEVGPSSSSMQIDGRNIHIGSSEGLYTLDKETGEVVWKNNFESISTKPFIYKNEIFCGSTDGNIYVFNSKTGEIIWSFPTGNEIISSPIVKDDTLYIGSNDGYFYSIDVKDRDLNWRFKTDGPIVSSPIINNQNIYFGSWDGNMYSLDLEKGRLNWRFSTGWGIDTTPVYYNKKIYFGSQDNNFYSIDADTGKLKWIFSTNGGIKSSPTIYGNHVFFGSSDGRIYALNSSNGKLKWSSAPSYYIKDIYNYKTTPIVAPLCINKGKVYVGSTNGNIYCYDSQIIEKSLLFNNKIKVNIDTWLFFFIPLLFVILVTGLYLYLSRRKNS